VGYRAELTIVLALTLAMYSNMSMTRVISYVVVEDMQFSCDGDFVKIRTSPQ